MEDLHFRTRTPYLASISLVICSYLRAMPVVGDLGLALGLGMMTLGAGGLRLERLVRVGFGSRRSQSVMAFMVRVFVSGWVIR